MSIGRQCVGAFQKRACRKNAFKHSHTAECGNRLRVEVRAKKLACRGLRVGPSKIADVNALLSNFFFRSRLRFPVTIAELLAIAMDFRTPFLRALPAGHLFDCALQTCQRLQ